MSKLKLDANFTDADAFYASLTDIHRDATPEESEKINARLILILANQIGDIDILKEALSMASNISSNSGSGTA